MQEKIFHPSIFFSVESKNSECSRTVSNIIILVMSNNKELILDAEKQIYIHSEIEKESLLSVFQWS